MSKKENVRVSANAVSRWLPDLDEEACVNATSRMGLRPPCRFPSTAVCGAKQRTIVDKGSS